MLFEKLPAIKEPQSNNCGTFNIKYGTIARMEMLIAAGFGVAQVSKDGAVVYDENDMQGQIACEYCDSGYIIGGERQELNDCDYCGGEGCYTDFWTVQNAETEAVKDPDHDWQIVIHTPMYGVTYQRQDVGCWVLVSKNDGFA